MTRTKVRERRRGSVCCVEGAPAAGRQLGLRGRAEWVAGDVVGSATANRRPRCDSIASPLRRRTDTAGAGRLATVTTAAAAARHLQPFVHS
uniref:Uncharacterized protein n=1 Tax=Angiostrongylus cantonensis TaxID=6313 RepID=A0A0K0DFJ4_ANGCA